MNPHGLTQDGHYTTAYDLYLIFNEAVQYEAFSEIIHMTNYQTTYYDKDGKAKELSFRIVIFICAAIISLLKMSR